MNSFKKWLLEDLNTLLNKTQELKADRVRNAMNVDQPIATIIPDPSKKEILVKSKINGQDDVYETSILFHNVHFKPIPENGQLEFGSFLLKGKDGNYYFDRLRTNFHDVKVKCTCPDFLYSFSHNNRMHNALLGSKSSEPSRTDRPGMCKHLIRLMDYLKEKDILTSGSW